jgi:DNA-binding transcriptional MerR regulator
MSKLYLLSDVARLMRKRPHQITYAITSGLLPEPKVRMGGRRVFQDEDIERIAQYFGVRLRKEAPCQSSWA